MILDNSIKVKNYKCFENEPQGFEKIYPINIIIGKNNSGKSSLIDLIDFVINGDDIFLRNGRNIGNVEVIISSKLQNELRCFREDTSGGGIPYANHYVYGTTLLGSQITYKLLNKRAKEIFYWEKPLIEAANNYAHDITNNIVLPFDKKIFRQISAERDILPENDRVVAIDFLRKNNIKKNGEGATSLIQAIINQSNINSQIIEETLLNDLNLVVQPDIEFRDIIVQRIDEQRWEVFLEDLNSTRIPLSKMGSGVKTILLVLLNLIVIPPIQGVEPSNYVFAFEELENNLHPSLLRRLFSYINTYASNNSAYFFITTHSNIVIDIFSNNANAQIIHTTNDKTKSICTTVSTFLDNKKILKDLEVRASDILQCNGIIWVEGPSDRTYLNKWLSLISDLKEGYHYSIMFYGGKLLANLSIEDNWLEKELVPLLKINSNAFVLIDRDGDQEDVKLNQTKTRIRSELGDKNCWITKGREVENYLTNATLTKWLSQHYKFTININNSINSKLENSISKIDKRVELKYNKNKRGYSMEIAEYISMQDLDNLDLKEKLYVLIRHIKEWNSL